MSKIAPHLWFAKEAKEAAEFYVSLFPDSRVDRITDLPADTPSGPAGTVHVVEFTLAGQQFMAISAGPLDPFNHAISFVVNCADQAEVDRLWDKLSQGGSTEPLFPAARWSARMVPRFPAYGSRGPGDATGPQ